MTDPAKQPGIIIENILLQKSQYERSPQVDSEGEVGLEVGLGIDDQGNKCAVMMKTIFTITSKETKEVQVKAEVEFIGFFRVDEAYPNMDLMTFAKKIAPNVLFPYIRQHIHNLNLSAGVHAIIQPLNFQALNWDEK
ncbi:MAG: protein-export chaperone SecB [Leptospiraceae bacterium]|nr:protein-export chaperone SecB [Leptospiraceae bacterium]